MKGRKNISVCALCALAIVALAVPVAVLATAGGSAPISATVAPEQPSFLLGPATGSGSGNDLLGSLLKAPTAASNPVSVAVPAPVPPAPDVTAPGILNIDLAGTLSGQTPGSSAAQSEAGLPLLLGANSGQPGVDCGVLGNLFASATSENGSKCGLLGNLLGMIV
ncbi:MAG: hypothetical protein ACT4OM_03170 [Actinomycetota bacterium]